MTLFEYDDDVEYDIIVPPLIRITRVLQLLIYMYKDLTQC